MSLIYMVWVHTWVDMGSHSRSFMDLESQTVSARVTKNFVTLFSKTMNIIKLFFIHFQRAKK